MSSGGRTSVYLDANVLIYAIEGLDEWRSPAGRLVEAANSGEIIGVTSELTLAEVLVRPLRVSDHELVRIYQELLAPEARIVSVPVSRSILLGSARLRAESGQKLADALHLATALEQRCEAMVTRDGALGVVASRYLRFRSLAEVDAIERMTEL